MTSRVQVDVSENVGCNSKSHIFVLSHPEEMKLAAALASWLIR